MDSSDVFGPKDVRQERWNRGEAAAVHRKYNEKARQKYGPIAVCSQYRNQQEQKKLHNEEGRVGVTAADVIRTGSPQEASACVKNTNQGDNHTGFERSFLEQVLHHRGGLRENPDPCRHVDKQNAPQEIKLDCPDG